MSEKQPDETSIKKYAEVMAEIKRRSRVLNLLLTGKLNIAYKATSIETCGLQFRKVFELIAFASLAANKRLYEQAHSNFARHWEAAKLIANLRALNPDFYPMPVIIKDSPAHNIKSEFVERTDGFLTPQELVEAHGRCGGLLHASNPFRRGIDFTFYETQFKEWNSKIIALLNAHKVHLPDDPPGFWLLQMRDFSTDDVSYTFFALLHDTKAAYDNLASKK